MVFLCSFISYYLHKIDLHLQQVLMYPHKMCVYVTDLVVQTSQDNPRHHHCANTAI